MILCSVMHKQPLVRTTCSFLSPFDVADLYRFIFIPVYRILTLKYGPMHFSLVSGLSDVS